MAGCADMGYEDTRPVQTAVIPMALEGRDVVACAETGTGKTLGFVVPILQRLLTDASEALLGHFYGASGQLNHLLHAMAKHAELNTR